MKTSLVITTINKLNTNLRNFIKKCKIKNWDLFIIGDRKTPIKSNKNKAYYYDINRQRKIKFKFAKICPENTYSRKNIGYLLSYKNGNEIIVETDDDNIPNKKFFRKIQIRHKLILSHSYDHRVIDGALGGKFAERVSRTIKKMNIKKLIRL